MRRSSPLTKACWVLNMNREFIFKLCKERYGTEPDYPFNDKYNSAVLRHSDTRKWYGIILNVSPKVFGLSSEEKVDIINLKIEPIMMGSFLQEKGIYPSYHMSKTCWISVLLDGTVSEETLSFLIDVSFELTDKKCKKNSFGA